MIPASPPIDQLEKLARICADTIARKDDPERMSIPFLHVLSAHPGGLEKYADMFGGLAATKKSVRNALARVALKGIAAMESPLPFSGDGLPQRADVLFISHFLRTSQASSGEDLYFGDIPRDLDEQGISSVVALINHSRQPWRKLGGWCAGSTPRVLLSRTIGLGREIELSRRLSVEAGLLRREAAARPDRFTRDVLLHAAADAGSPGSLTAMRIAAQVFDLVSRLQPHAMVTTYEGHSWERLAYEAARRANPAVRCIGYHHAMLFPFPDAMTRRYGPRYDPDTILTAGDVSRDWLRDQQGLGGIPISTLGSVRTIRPANSPAPLKSPAVCLVMPEGLVSESVMLARCAADTARAMPHIAFRVRLHPLLKPRDVEKAASDLRLAPSNFSWSSGSLHDDLASSRWALYRGTTAVVPAVLSGLKPIYLAGNGPGLSFDPLAELRSWRETASSAAVLAEIISRDIGETDMERQSQYEIARAYCQACFRPVDLAALQSAIGR